MLPGLFSRWVSGGYSLVAVVRVLIAGASLLAEHGLRVQELQQSQLEGSVVAAPGLQRQAQ